jgi:hypothetical protein
VFQDLDHGLGGMFKAFDLLEKGLGSVLGHLEPTRYLRCSKAFDLREKDFGGVLYVLDDGLGIVLDRHAEMLELLEQGLGTVLQDLGRVLGHLEPTKSLARCSNY